jgi:hypothetical protein
MKAIEDCSYGEIVRGLNLLGKKYPAVFRHFVMSEVDPEGYDEYIHNLGKDNDSQRSDSRLGQEQETNSG